MRAEGGGNHLDGGGGAVSDRERKRGLLAPPSDAAFPSQEMVVSPTNTRSSGTRDGAVEHLGPGGGTGEQVPSPDRTRPYLCGGEGCGGGGGGRGGEG